MAPDSNSRLRGCDRSLQVRFALSFSHQKILNAVQCPAVYMIEDRRVVAGEAILNGASIERSGIQSTDAILEGLVREHSRLVYRIAYSVLRQQQDAEDATQETFMRVLRYQSKLEGVIDLKTWLARIAWRVALDRSKRRGRMKEITLDDAEKPVPEPPSASMSADEKFQVAQTGIRLERLVAALPEKLRQPLILSTIEEMTPREVALTLGINEAAVRSRVFRARQILREKLEGLIEKKI